MSITAHVGSSAALRALKLTALSLLFGGLTFWWGLGAWATMHSRERSILLPTAGAIVDAIAWIVEILALDSRISWRPRTIVWVLAVLTNVLAFSDLKVVSLGVDTR